MSFGQVEGFFVDSCVLLPHALESVRRSSEAFLKESASRCMISSSVKKEAIDLIEKAYTIIVSDFRSTLKPFLQQQGITAITKRHGKLLGDFFAERKKSVRLQLPTRSNVPNEIIGATENYVSSQLHSLENSANIAADDFLGSLITNLTIVRHELKAPFMGLKGIDIDPDTTITSLMILKTLIANPNDVNHLVSALMYQFRTNKWIIFVTVDETEILARQVRIFEIFALQCTKPNWASDYYGSMTRLKSPVQHYQDIHNYTVEQKEFAEKIQKCMGIQITS
jgi:hypothetical protein